MTILSAMILLALFAVFIAGLWYLCCRLRDCLDKIGNAKKKQDNSLTGPLSELSEPDQITVSNILASAEPMVTLSNLVRGQTFQCTVDFSTNLTDWEPYTNFTANFEEWDLRLPQQPERGPMGFYRITTFGSAASRPEALRDVKSKFW